MAEISEKSFPFDSDEVSGIYDREYFAEDWTRYFAAFISSGTFLKEPTNLQIIANGDMSVTLKPGSMMIDGTRYDNVADIIIQLDPADGVLSRIDRIAVTWSKADRDAHYTLQKGIQSYNPMPPACRRDAEYKDYVVADVRIDAGIISINQSAITDQRLNSEVCGLAIPFADFNTSSLALQLQAFYEETIAAQMEWEQDIHEQIYQWFKDMQDQLSSDAAFNLQKQIGLLEKLSTENKENLVSAINEVNAKKIDVLDTREEIEANTNEGKVAGALAVKEMVGGLENELSTLNGKLLKYYRGAIKLSQVQPGGLKVSVTKPEDATEIVDIYVTAVRPTYTFETIVEPISYDLQTPAIDFWTTGANIQDYDVLYTIVYK